MLIPSCSDGQNKVNSIEIVEMLANNKIFPFMFMCRCFAYKSKLLFYHLEGNLSMKMEDLCLYDLKLCLTGLYLCSCLSISQVADILYILPLPFSLLE